MKSQARILIVEDDVIVARDIGQQLRQLGFDPVGHAMRAEQAIVLAGDLRPDLVLMDIQLGAGMDGITAAVAMRARFAIPVVFLTAFASEETLERVQLAEPYGYILKPFVERELRIVIQMALFKSEAENRLRATAQYNQTILDNMVDGVVTVDGDGAMESCNPAFSAMFGYPSDGLRGRRVADLMPDSDWSCSAVPAAADPQPVRRQHQLQGLRQDGDPFPLTLSVSQMQLQDRQVLIGLVRDHSQHQRDMEEIRRLAYHDVMTGLPNRRLFLERLSDALEASGSQVQHGAVMLLDLDHFKSLNDALGHAAGDAILQQVARRLRVCVPDTGSVSRLHGDQFALLVVSLGADGRVAAELAEALVGHLFKQLSAPYAWREHCRTVTPSIGIVVFRAGQVSTDALLQQAELAVHQAKAAGRNTACFFDPSLQAAFTARTRLEEDLRAGLERQEFVLHYQVQVDAESRVLGAEALVRWLHPQHGMVPPAQFIPLAEETGLILPLGQWVLETACLQLVAWSQNATTAQRTISVNVSALQFTQPDFVRSVAAAIDKAGADPRLLKLELTESMLSDDLQDVVEKMHRIKALGVCFSLDDFGTGYSSLSLLKRLPLEQLKIDQSFVRDILVDGNDAVIARTVVSLGHNLGMKVIAEGVETVAQRDFLAGLGCDAYQGYLFGRPGSASTIG